MKVRGGATLVPISMSMIPFQVRLGVFMGRHRLKRANLLILR